MLYRYRKTVHGPFSVKMIYPLTWMTVYAEEEMFTVVGLVTIPSSLQTVTILQQSYWIILFSYISIYLHFKRVFQSDLVVATGELLLYNSLVVYNPNQSQECDVTFFALNQDGDLLVADFTPSVHIHSYFHFSIFILFDLILSFWTVIVSPLNPSYYLRSR